MIKQILKSEKRRFKKAEIDSNKALTREEIVEQLEKDSPIEVDEPKNVENLITHEDFKEMLQNTMDEQFEKFSTMLLKRKKIVHRNYRCETNYILKLQKMPMKRKVTGTQTNSIKIVNKATQTIKQLFAPKPIPSSLKKLKPLTSDLMKQTAKNASPTANEKVQPRKPVISKPVQPIETDDNLTPIEAKASISAKPRIKRKSSTTIDDYVKPVVARKVSKRAEPKKANSRSIELNDKKAMPPPTTNYAAKKSVTFVKINSTDKSALAEIYNGRNDINVAQSVTSSQETHVSCSPPAQTLRRSGKSGQNSNAENKENKSQGEKRKLSTVQQETQPWTPFRLDELNEKIGKLPEIGSDEWFHENLKKLNNFQSSQSTMSVECSLRPPKYHWDKEKRVIYKEVPLEEVDCEIVKSPPKRSKSMDTSKSTGIEPSPFKNVPIQRKVHELQSMIESPSEDDFAPHFLSEGLTSTQN